MLLIVSQLFLLLTLEGTHALEHLIPVDQCTIELRTIDADELRLAANRESAGTAHTRTIHHDRIQRYFAGDIVLLSREVREFHHDGRADGEHLIDVLLLEKLLHSDSYHALLAVRAIIGHDDHLVRAFANLVLKDNQILRATSHHREHTVASGLQRLDNRQHRSHAQTTTGTDDGAVFLNLRGIAQRAYHVSHIVTLIECTEFLG